MTKRHLVAIADTLRNIQIRYENAGDTSIIKNDPRVMLEQVKMQLADLFQGDNPAFNRERWLDYINSECGPSGGTIKAPEQTRFGMLERVKA